mmetsp:Transcript_30832/g.86440  ORF Transcript_30832/g.86440 Transcript_30832/m.86440 type:complete len:178 (+) Transcript_30832:3-536(+)
MMPNVVMPGEDIAPTTKACLLVLFDGTLAQACPMKSLFAAKDLDVFVLPVIAQDGFRVPDALMMKDLGPTLLHNLALCELSTDIEHIHSLIRHIFAEIAVTFIPQENEHVLETKAATIASRMLTKATKSTSSVKFGPTAFVSSLTTLREHGAVAPPVVPPPDGVEHEDAWSLAVQEI